MLLLLVACSENQLQEKTEPQGFDSDSGYFFPDDSQTREEELCNGVDDDGDGDVDEGFPDADANGRVDCLDATCPSADLPTASVVTVREDCDGGGGLVTDPWNVVAEWRLDSGGTGIASTVAVGNLTDDNGDGVIDDEDVPDIAYGEWGGSDGVVISGDGSGEVWRVSGVETDLSPIIGDIDGDGRNDVLFFDTQARAVLYAGDGTVIWSATDKETGAYAVPTACDLDGDGTVEVISGRLVLNGADGTLRVSLPSEGYSTPACADLDQDGRQEILYGDTVYDADGNEVFSVGIATTYGRMPAVIQADGDDAGELVVAADAKGVIVDDDGTELAALTYTGSLTGPPCVADFDGDGASEVVIPSNTTLSLFEADGTRVWSIVTGDGSGFAGCSAWDVDDDGAYEVLFAGETRFRIFDGRTGGTLFETTDHNSVTIYEYPVVADVDHDGAAEVITVENVLSGGGTGLTGLTVWGQAANTWPRTTATHGMHDFSESNQDADGRFPTLPTASWLEYGLFRGRANHAQGAGGPDLRAHLVDACVADCDYGPVQVTVQAENVGASDADAGASLDLYAVDEAGERLIWSTVLPAIPSGMSTDAILVEVPIDERGDGRWRLVVDAADEIRECDDDDNTDVWNDVVCL